MSEKVTMATTPQDDIGTPESGPSAHLITLMRACSKDPTEEIKTRLSRMLQEFLEHYRNSEENENTQELAQRCCLEAEVRYYRILENIVDREKERVDTSDLLWIFGQDLFQRCLVACCLEIERTSHRLTCDFTLLLEVFKLPAYHFQKVIEAVLRFGLGLSPALVKHLCLVENKVLESLAWTSESPLWKDIGANEGHLPTSQQVIPLRQLEHPLETDLGPDQAPEAVSLETGPSSSMDQQPSSSGVNRAKGNTLLCVFSRKVYKLMAQRLTELCSQLDISDQLRLNIWTCLEHALVRHTRIMENRNLEHLLLCAIYHTAKVCKDMLISERAEEILPREVRGNGDHAYAILTPSTPSGDGEGGISLYEIYRMKMQYFAEKFAPTFVGDTPPLSPYPQQQTQSSRSHSLASYNIFISPMTTEATARLTPRFCYNFNSSPREYLREINNVMRTGGSSNVQRLTFNNDDDDDDDDEEEDDDDDEEEDGPSPKRLCLNGQSALQKRLRTMVNDRERVQNQNQNQNQVQVQVQPLPAEDLNLQQNTEEEDDDDDASDCR